MTELVIVTNHVPREIIDAWFLTEDERAEFDYLPWDDIAEGNDTASFFRYRGELHDLGEFMRWDGVPFSPLAEWDGYRSDNFFSGLLVRFADPQCETVIVARYYS